MKARRSSRHCCNARRLGYGRNADRSKRKQPRRHHDENFELILALYSGAWIYQPENRRWRGLD